jgi:arabinosyltransferase C
MSRAQALTFERFSAIVAAAAGAAALLPFIVGLAAGVSAGGPSLYQGTAVDDQMVYAAWMTQAGEGRLLFDNRFAVDAQPGLTINLYFLVLGWIGRLIGVPEALALAKPVFAVLLVLLLARLIRRIGLSRYASKLALGLAVWGGGIGFIGWQQFGQVAPEGSMARSLFGPFLPVDVWQTEALALPSMIVNGLFSASLCLIIGILLCVMEARRSWKPALPGAAMMLVLMNIHSYDVALLGLVLLGGLVGAISRAGRVEWGWVGRTLVISLGAAPAVGWFLYVLANDPVFQARAATLTYSPKPMQVIFGILPALSLAMAGIWVRGRQTPIRRWSLGILGGSLLVAAIATSGADPGQGFVIGWAGWAAWIAATLAGLALNRPNMPERALMASWAWMGLAAPYLPMLFQRKLLMGIAIPWALLAAWGAAGWIERRTKDRRNAASAAVLAIAGLSSLFWLQRELLFIRSNVSSTTVNKVQYRPETFRILEMVRARSGRTVALALPGFPAPAGPEGPAMEEPVITDLNPLLAGLAGAYAYAGHWSETPDYNSRRQKAIDAFFGPPEVRAAALEEIDPDIIVMPHPESFPAGQLPHPEEYGRIAFEGENWILIERA